MKGKWREGSRVDDGSNAAGCQWSRPIRALRCAIRRHPLKLCKPLQQSADMAAIDHRDPVPVAEPLASGVIPKNG